MKRTILCLVLVRLTIAVPAQPITREETQTLLSVPVLDGRTAPIAVLPNIGTLCFDKKLIVSSTESDGRELRTCLYINTRGGYLGFYSERAGSTGSCSIDPERDGFRFTLISMTGNTYQYLTMLKSGRVEKKVVTHNSDFYYYPWTGLNPETAVLRRLEETGLSGHRRARMETRAYQAAGSRAKFYLFGNTLPAEIRVTSAARYLGTFGIGYGWLGNQVYLIMDLMDEAQSVAAVREIYPEENCFNTEGFTTIEDEFYNKAKASIRTQREKLLNERITSGPCSSFDLMIKNFKLDALTKQEAWLEKTMQGNLLIDATAQDALANMYVFEEQIQVAIYEQEKKICRLEQRSASGSSSEASRQKLECYRRQLNQMRTNQAELAEIDRRYPSNPGMRTAEKQKLMARMELCN